MIISKTPFRISFFGGGTDFPDYYNNHDGYVIGSTIDKYCYITLRKLPPFFKNKHRIVWSKIQLQNTINHNPPHLHIKISPKSSVTPPIFFKVQLYIFFYVFYEMIGNKLLI